MKAKHDFIAIVLCVGLMAVSVPGVAESQRDIETVPLPLVVSGDQVKVLNLAFERLKARLDSLQRAGMMKKSGYSSIIDNYVFHLSKMSNSEIYLVEYGLKAVGGMYFHGSSGQYEINVKTLSIVSEEHSM